MPRNRRRVVDTMSDHIEEDDATQRQEVDPVDGDEDEDEQPRPARRTLSRSVLGESSRVALARSAPDIERDDDAQDATPVFDEEDTLGNKPLSRHDAQKLQGMASDWNMIETHLRESAFSLLTEVSTAVAEYADDSTAKKVTTLCALLRPAMPTSSLHIQELGRLDTLVREIIDIDVEIRSHEQTLKDLHQQVVAGDEIVSCFSALYMPLIYLNAAEQRTGTISNANAG